MRLGKFPSINPHQAAGTKIVINTDRPQRILQDKKHPTGPVRSNNIQPHGSQPRQQHGHNSDDIDTSTSSNTDSNDSSEDINEDSMATSSKSDSLTYRKPLDRNLDSQLTTTTKVLLSRIKALDETIHNTDC